MIKLDDAIKKETVYIAIWVIIFSFVMEAVFLLTKTWDYTVLLGNIYSAAFSVLNFFLMGVGVQKALSKKDEKQAKSTIKMSHSLRTLMLFAVAAVGALVDCFNIWSVLIPLLFPRIAVLISGLTKRN